MKILLYNIFKGGHGPDGADRMPLITRVVKESEADIVGILEANGWDASDDLLRLSQSTNLSHAFLSQSNTKYHLALLSKEKPLSSTSIKEGVWHSIIHAVIRAPVGETDVFAVHLNPRTEEDRLGDLETLKKYIDPSRPAIIMGDMNSLSRHDPYPENTLQNVQNAGITKFGTDTLRFDVINTLEEWGMRDVGMNRSDAEFHTEPANPHLEPHHIFPMRIDYFFVSKHFENTPMSYHVIRNHETRKASDHYPIIITF